MMNDLISRQTVIEKMRNHRRLFCKNHMEYSILSKDEKARVDEIDNCIACLLNEPKEESKPKWIPVTEALPKNNEDVLVYGIEAINDKYLYAVKCWNMDTWRPLSAPSVSWIAWQPLTKPWKVK